MQIPPGANTDDGILASVFMGLAISRDHQVVYVAGGQANKVYIFSIEDGKKLDSVNCSQGPAGAKYPDGYIGDMVLGKDGKYLFAVDQTSFRLVIMDTRKKEVEGIPAVGGSSPNSLVVISKYVFVSNGNNDNISGSGILPITRCRLLCFQELRKVMQRSTWRFPISSG